MARRQKTKQSSVKQQEEDAGALGFSDIGTAFTLFKKLVPIRKGFSKTDKAFMAKYGSWRIQSMTIIRTPLSSYVDKALNLLSVGEWQSTKSKVGYDKMFHLAIIGMLQPPAGLNATPIKFITERNDTVRIREFEANDVGRDTQTMDVPLTNATSRTLNNIFDTAIRDLGDRLWEYDPFTNNCQNYVLQILGEDNLLTPQIQHFVLQNIASVASSLDKINPYTTGIAKGLIGLSARLRALTGKGLNAPHSGPIVDYSHEEAGELEDDEGGSFTSMFNNFSNGLFKGLTLGLVDI